jgi:predicted kinase
LKGDSALPLCLTEAYSLLATEAREHPATAADILEHGFFHCKRARALEMSFKPAGLTLVARGATTALILNGQSREGPKEYTLSLANQPEHALVLASEDYCGQSLGPSDSAMRIVSDDPFLRRGDNLSRVFDCAVTGEYEEGTTVGMFDKHGCDNQKFVVNDDWTVSPLLAPSMVLGWWSGPQKTDVDPLNGAAVFAAQNPAPVSIIIRGPSGSGKSTMADAVVKSLRDAGRQVCVLEQDYVRKTMLGSGKSAAEVSAEMLRVCADAALGQGYDVILEGILNSDPSQGGMYRPLLQSLCNRNGPTLLFYLDVPIETTKARHAGRSKAAKFGPEKLDVWWQSSQKTGLSGEIIIRSSDMDADRTAATILRHLHDCGA